MQLKISYLVVKIYKLVYETQIWDSIPKIDNILVIGLWWIAYNYGTCFMFKWIF